MRVVLTGHLGYIGAVLGPALVRAGHDVRGLDSGLYNDCVLGPPPPHIPGDGRRDLRDLTAADVQGADAIVHLAALSNDPLGELDAERTHDINHRASTRLAQLARDAGVGRFVYASSCSIYGAADTSRALDESAEFAPVTAYAVSKVAVERDLLELADDAFSPVFLRNATAYGFSPRLRCDIVVNDLVGRALLEREVTVLSDGTPWRPLAHVEDIAAAAVAAIDAPREAVHAEAFNVGRDADNHQVADLAGCVAGAVGDVEVRVTGEHGPDPRSYRVDFGKITQHLPGFTPTWDLERGVRQLYAAYREHGLTVDGFATTFRRLPWLLAQLAQGRLDADLRWVGDA